jgi:hypothetical protein
MNKHLLVLFGCLLLSISSFGDDTNPNKLNLVYTTDDHLSFNKIEVSLTGNTYAGVIYGVSGSGQIQARTDGDKFTVVLGGPSYRSSFQITHNETRSGYHDYYRGLMPGQKQATFDFYVEPKKEEMSFRGTVKEVPIEGYVSRKEFYIHWKTFSISLTKMKNEPGSCEGGMYYEDGMNRKRLGEFYCETSGELTDAFFKRPQDTIAWIIGNYVDID